MLVISYWFVLPISHTLQNTVKELYLCLLLAYIPISRWEFIAVVIHSSLYQPAIKWFSQLITCSAKKISINSKSSSIFAFNIYSFQVSKLDCDWNKEKNETDPGRETKVDNNQWDFTMELRLNMSYTLQNWLSYIP